VLSGGNSASTGPGARGRVPAQLSASPKSRPHEQQQIELGHPVVWRTNCPLRISRRWAQRKGNDWINVPDYLGCNWTSDWHCGQLGLSRGHDSAKRSPKPPHLACANFSVQGATYNRPQRVTVGIRRRSHGSFCFQHKRQFIVLIVAGNIARRLITASITPRLVASDFCIALNFQPCIPKWQANLLASNRAGFARRRPGS